MMTKDDGLFLDPSDGILLTNPIGGQMVLKLADQVTGGAYSLHTNTLLAGSPGPRPHLHRKHEEVFYVLAGELTVRMGMRTITALPGSLVVIPRGVVHQPSNPGTQPTQVLLLFSPEGMGSFFLEAVERHIPLQAMPTNPSVQEALEDFCRKYSYEFADFPSGA